MNILKRLSLVTNVTKWKRHHNLKAAQNMNLLTSWNKIICIVYFHSLKELEKRISIRKHKQSLMKIFHLYLCVLSISYAQACQG